MLRVDNFNMFGGAGAFFFFFFEKKIFVVFDNTINPFGQFGVAN